MRAAMLRANGWKRRTSVAFCAIKRNEPLYLSLQHVSLSQIVPRNLRNFTSETRNTAECVKQEAAYDTAISFLILQQKLMAGS